MLARNFVAIIDSIRIGSFLRIQKTNYCIVEVT